MNKFSKIAFSNSKRQMKFELQVICRLTDIAMKKT